MFQEKIIINETGSEFGVDFKPPKYKKHLAKYVPKSITRKH